MNTIISAIDLEFHTAWSVVGREVYGPIIDFENMGPQDGFEMKWKYEKLPMDIGFYQSVFFTKKIPLAERNRHREFWGFKPIKSRGYVRIETHHGSKGDFHSYYNQSENVWTVDPRQATLYQTDGGQDFIPIEDAMILFWPPRLRGGAR